jgi:hypothetical protein
MTLWGGVFNLAPDESLRQLAVSATIGWRRTFACG